MKAALSVLKLCPVCLSQFSLLLLGYDYQSVPHPNDTLALSLYP